MVRKLSGDMSDFFCLSHAQMERLEPYFPKSHGKPRVGDTACIFGVLFLNRNGLRWRDEPMKYGPQRIL